LTDFSGRSSFSDVTFLKKHIFIKERIIFCVMKAVKFFRSVLAFHLLASILILGSCGEDGEPAPTPNGNNRSFPLRAQSTENIFGEIIFAEYSDGSVNFIIELNNTVSGNIHPAFLYFDNAVDGQDVRLTLEL